MMNSVYIHVGKVEYKASSFPGTMSLMLMIRRS